MKYLLIIAIILSSCIEEIAFSNEQQPGTLVVDGTISTFADTNYIRLFYTGNLGDQSFSPELGATVSLHDERGNGVPAGSLNNGYYYFLRAQLAVEVGQTYFINIKTNNGHTYQSEKETILPSPDIQKLVFDFEIEQIVERETRVLERSFFNLSVQTNLPANTNSTYLKWDVEHIFTVEELICSPIVPPDYCYIKRPIDRNKIFLLNGDELAGGAEIEERIAHVEMDYAFGLVASFYVSQKSLTPTIYNYWKNINQIITGGGSIFEAPPATVFGNILPVSHPDDEVLGIFSAVDEKKELILITRGDLATGFDRLPFCGQLGFPPSNVSAACCNCLSLENSSLTRPSYWP